MRVFLPHIYHVDSIKYFLSPSINRFLRQICFSWCFFFQFQGFSFFFTPFLVVSLLLLYFFLSNNKSDKPTMTEGINY